MSEWNDDVEPEEPTRRNEVRRAVLGGVAGVTMLVAPIALANAIVPEDDEGDVQADDGNRDSSLVALRRDNQESARLADEARLSSALAITTTTTTAPPTTTTTAPPTTTTTAPTTTTTVEEVEPPPDSGSGQLGDPYYYPSWDALAECEAGGDWHINTGNGYYGGLQFSLSSWQAVGGTGYPHEHSRDTQIAMGIRLWESGGWGHWPACSAELGYR